MKNSIKDSYTKPAFSLNNRIARSLWRVIWITLFRPSPKIFFGWRNFLLKIFGAKIGQGSKIHQSATVWAPWNLILSDTVSIAAGVNIYNPALVLIGSHAIVSEDAYLCGASHLYQEVDFELYAETIKLGEYSWVCARACVMPGVTIHAGAVLGVMSVATKDLSPWAVYAGAPAKFIKKRNQHNPNLNNA